MTTRLVVSAALAASGSRNQSFSPDQIQYYQPFVPQNSLVSAR